MDTILWIIAGIVVAILLVREKVNQLSLQDDQDDDSEENQADSDEKELKKILQEIGDERDGSYAFEDDAYDIHELLPLLNTIAYIARNPHCLETPSPFRDSILSSSLICSWLEQQPGLLGQLSEEVLATIHQNAK